MNVGPTNRPKLVADPFVRVTDEEATLQLVAGLRFHIRAESVKPERDEGQSPLSQPQRALRPERPVGHQSAGGATDAGGAASGGPYGRPFLPRRHP